MVATVAEVLMVTVMMGIVTETCEGGGRGLVPSMVVRVAATVIFQVVKERTLILIAASDDMSRNKR